MIRTAMPFTMSRSVAQILYSASVMKWSLMLYCFKFAGHRTSFLEYEDQTHLPELFSGISKTCVVPNSVSELTERAKLGTRRTNLCRERNIFLYSLFSSTANSLWLQWRDSAVSDLLVALSIPGECGAPDFILDFAENQVYLPPQA